VSDVDAIWQAILQSNASWVGGRPREVASLFHANAVMIAPDGKTRIAGRDAIVQSFVDYCAYAKTHEFRELDHSVEVMGDTAVATYRFFVKFEAEGSVQSENGQEVLVFQRDGERWSVIWRTQIFLGAS
jgi:ketosteroid isomerase-like protein